MDICKAAESTLHIVIVTQNGRWPDGGELSQAHIAHLLVNIRDKVVTGEKAHRWLGWAQCAATAAGVTTLEEMKAVNHAA